MNEPKSSTVLIVLAAACGLLVSSLKTAAERGDHARAERVRYVTQQDDTAASKVKEWAAKGAACPEGTSVSEISEQ